MSAFLKQAVGRFEALQPRERLGVVGAAAATMVFVLNLALIDPQEKKKKSAAHKLDAQQSELKSLRTEITKLSEQVKQDPLPKEKAILDELKTTVSQADALLAQVEADTPQMGALVRDLVQATPGLTLVSLKTLPVLPLIEPRATSAPAAGKTAAPAQPLTIYRHGVEISIRGNYLALLPYVQKLQASPKRKLWADATMEVKSYPDAVLKLTLYTLSSKPASTLG
jgi:MSHA biogenesis protein MshJ